MTKLAGSNKLLVHVQYHGNKLYDGIMSCNYCNYLGNGQEYYFEIQDTLMTNSWIHN